MPSRTIEIDGATWRVQPSGFVTQYDADEYGVLFVRAGAPRELRVTRYRPTGVRGRDRSLAACSDAAIRELFAQSQPSDTSPEGGYAQ
jgi:hypothetical protein